MVGMGKRGLLVAAMAALAVAVFSSPGSAADKKVFYLLSHGGPSDAFWIDWNAGATKACEPAQRHLQDLVQWRRHGGAEGGVQFGDRCHPDGIAHDLRAAGPVEEGSPGAKKAGIPIVFFNTDDPATGRQAYVGADLNEAGAIWAKYFVDHKMVK